MAEHGRANGPSSPPCLMHELESSLLQGPEKREWSRVEAFRKAERAKLLTRRRTFGVHDRARYAESLAAQGKLAEALNEFSQIPVRYPKGDKIAIAQFRQGVVLLRLEKRIEGVEALKTVMSLYPDSREAAMARSELLRLGEIESNASPTSPSATPRQRPQR